MDPNHGNITAMGCTTHIDTTSNGHPKLARKFFLQKVIDELIHKGFG
jgi:hypothetical protein